MFIFCLEMGLFAMLHWFAFSYKDFTTDSLHMGMLQNAKEVLSVKDIVRDAYHNFMPAYQHYVLQNEGKGPKKEFKTRTFLAGNSNASGPGEGDIAVIQAKEIMNEKQRQQDINEEETKTNFDAWPPLEPDYLASTPAAPVTTRSQRMSIDQSWTNSQFSVQSSGLSSQHTIPDQPSNQNIFADTRITNNTTDEEQKTERAIGPVSSRIPPVVTSFTPTTTTNRRGSDSLMVIPSSRSSRSSKDAKSQTP
eukprot:TRINITY_DN53873_c0_g1_i3.p1 TRINITY_DN53873_c0_g1~~TRINITY_DN53873_c0_g1_i3.p1  ORF type:complete len:250 (+),score=51.35 TRINITY_DN53873_c0_g1_i3:336-1085(+)